MTSIRQRLLLWLAFGMALILVAGGTAMYFGLRAGLLSNMDDELRLACIGARQILAGEKRAAKQGVGSKALRRWELFGEEGSGLYFQMWNPQGLVIERSPSLGEDTLPAPPPNTTEEQGFNLEDANSGRRFRAMVFHMAGPRKPLRAGAAGEKTEKDPADPDKRRLVLVVRDREDTDRTLSLLAVGLGVVGLAMGGGAAFLITRGLGRGLRPLQEMGRQAENIDAHSLSARFDIGGLPKELAPIAGRLNDLMARLEASFERERRFSADLAHEIRTPLAELRAAAESALRWPEQVTATDFSGVLESTRRMQEIVEKLLALARAEHAAARSTTEPVRLAPVLAEVLQPVQSMIEEKQLEVVQSVPAETEWMVDPGLLRLILDNLVSNALEYTPPGGRIAIRGDADSLALSNTAGPVTADDVGRFFDRCWRREPSRSDVRHAGLGLSLARTCAESMEFDLSARLENDLVTLELKRRSDVVPDAR